MSDHGKPWDARLAGWLVWPLVDTPAHPNHLTTVRLLVGLAGAICFARGDAPNVAACLIVLSNFLDHTDGELARLSGKSSRFGHCYDLLSDAVVTVGMFIGIGVGLTPAAGGKAAVMGLIAGLAVAGIFQLRNVLEQRHGKAATRQPRFVGFEAEDILYLLPLVTLADGLSWFLYAAAIGAPLALFIVGIQYLRVADNAGGGAG